MAIKSVAIIGAGPSGLITLDALIRENRFDVIRLFERRGEAGGCWVFDNSPPDPLGNISDLSERTAVKPEVIPDSLPAYVPKSNSQRFNDSGLYPYLETNVEAKVMEYSQEPFPAIGSKRSITKYGDKTPFRHHTVVKSWLQGLYKTKGYDDHLVFNTSVELVKKNQEAGNYTLTLRRLGKRLDYMWNESFDAVVVATGHYDVPYLPDIDGLQEFSDNPETIVIHSKGFRSREHFRGKKTIVVGASVSAMDSIQDILDVVLLPAISSQKMSSRPHVYFGDVAFKHPNIDCRSEIVKIDNDTKTVYFDDDTSVSGVDAIIFGTGFTYSYPFLPDLNLQNNRVHGLYQHIFNIDDPTLAFVGAIQAGLTFKVFEWQAVYVARVFSERALLPDISTQKKWETDRISERGDGAFYTAILPHFEQYFEGIRLAAGDGEGIGRQLPVWDPSWEYDFWNGHRRRMNYWAEHNHTDEFTTTSSQINSQIKIGEILSLLGLYKLNS